MFTYVIDAPDCYQVQDEIAGIEAIRKKHPGAHVGRWNAMQQTRELPIWANAGSEFRWSCGDKTEPPIAFITQATEEIETMIFKSGRQVTPTPLVEEDNGRC